MSFPSSYFSNKRGRPASNKPKCDSGTNELVKKKKACLTQEALDLCYTRQLISQDQRNAGIYFRQLSFSVGTRPGFRAVDYSKIRGEYALYMHHIPDSGHEARREQKYLKLREVLKKSGLFNMVNNLCIYNHYPSFLIDPDGYAHELQQIKIGLDLLAKFFRIN